MISRINWRFWERERSGCEAIEPLLSLYVDQMASAAETRRVEAHLSVCQECRQALQWMQATHQVIARRPIVAPPPDLSLRIAQAIAAAQGSKTLLRPAPRPTLAFRPALAYGLSVALVAAVSGAVFLTAGHHEAQQPGQIAHIPTITPNALSPIPPIHLPVPNKTADNAPETHPHIHSVRPLPMPSAIAVNPPPPAPVLLKPRHSAAYTIPQPETVAVVPKQPSLLPSPIKTHLAPPQTHIHAAPPHEANPLLAKLPSAHAEHNLPAKQHAAPQPAASSGTLIAKLPPGPTGLEHPNGVQPVVAPPVITQQPVHVAVASLSLNDQLHAIADTMKQVPLTASKFEEKSAVIGLASAGSGTLDIVHSDVH